jgi:RecA-family ATPase
MITVSENKKQEIKAMSFMTLKELAALPEDTTRFILQGLLPGSGSSILGSPPKTGKSTFSRALAVAVAQGTSFIGRTTIQGEVLFLALEEKRTETLPQFLLLGATDDDPIFPKFVLDEGKAHAIESLEKAIEERPSVRLIVVDTLFKFLHIRDGNDYTEVSEKIAPLTEMARRHSLHILMTHHCKKRKGEDFVENLLGSQALGGAVDTILAYTKNAKGERVLETAQRIGDGLAPTVLGWNTETHSLSIGSTVEELDEERAASLEATIERDIVKFVTDHSGCEQAAIFEGVKHKKVTVQAAFKKIRHSKLEERGEGTKNDPYKYFLNVKELPTETGGAL